MCPLNAHRYCRIICWRKCRPARGLKLVKISILASSDNQTNTVDSQYIQQARGGRGLGLLRHWRHWGDRVRPSLVCLTHCNMSKMMLAWGWRGWWEVNQPECSTYELEDIFNRERNQLLRDVVCHAANSRWTCVTHRIRHRATPGGRSSSLPTWHYY